MIQLVHPVQGLDQKVFYGAVVFAAPGLLLGDIEDELLGVIQYLVAVPPVRIEHGLADVVGHADQLPEDGTLADDIRVRGDIAGPRGVFGERGEIRETAGVLELLMAVQPLRHGNDVAGFAFAIERGDGLEDDAMILAVEVFSVDVPGNLLPDAVIQQDAAEYGHFGLDGMRGYFERRCFLIPAAGCLDDVLHSLPLLKTALVEETTARVVLVHQPPGRNGIGKTGTALAGVNHSEPAAITLPRRQLST